MTTHQGRVVLVTGATRGIGLACAKRLVGEGASVVLTGREAAHADDVARSLEPLGDARVIGLGFEQGRADSCPALVKAIHGEFGRLDGLIANAGIHHAARLGMVTDAAIDEIFAVNASGLVRLLQGAMRLLRRGTTPSVVLMGSIMGRAGAAGQAAYAMSKAAVEGLAIPAARELAAIGGRVNVLSPGYVDTDMTSTLSDEERAAVIASTPLGRLAHPDEIAAVASFLLSADSSFVTGQVLGVNGGLRG